MLTVHSRPETPPRKAHRYSCPSEAVNFRDRELMVAIEVVLSEPGATCVGSGMVKLGMGMGMGIEETHPPNIDVFRRYLLSGTVETEPARGPCFWTKDTVAYSPPFRLKSRITEGVRSKGTVSRCRDARWFMVYTFVTFKVVGQGATRRYRRS